MIGFKFLRSANRWFLRKRGVERANQMLRLSHPLKLDLGSGGRKRAGFVDLDLCAEADIQWDIRWGIPFPDESVAEIRSDHFLEHLELPIVVDVLHECYRVLVPKGVLDFTVPHFDPYIEAYTRHDFNFLKQRIHDIPNNQEYLYATCFDRIAWLLHRSGEHKSLFDRESILHKVRLGGFSDVTTREYDEAKDDNRRFSSIYVVAIK